MKYKLKPQTGLLIAGLLSSAYANACWYTTSMVCYSSGIQVDTVYFSPSSKAIYASADWEIDYGTQTPNGFGKPNNGPNVYCSGPAHFANPITMGNETISYWQDNVGSGGSATPKDGLPTGPGSC